MYDSSPTANLVAVKDRMDSLSRFLSESISLNAPFNSQTLHFASSQIVAALDQIVLSGTALLSASAASAVAPSSPDAGDASIVEIDAAELLTQRVHTCDICGKAFRRDANLRMHMRAHGDQFKTAEALAGPDRTGVRFSCPVAGCGRNKAHRRFRALKSAACARNHFRRSHCPKTYACGRCEKKRFALPADLRNHLRTCLVLRWRCSCGASFSRKDELFGHVAVLDGHLPEEPDQGLVDNDVVDDDDDDDRLSLSRI